MRPFSNDIAVLTSARTEFEARAIVLALEAEGVRTHVSGGTPGECMGPVNVFVRREDLPEASLALEVIRLEAATLDWTAVESAPDDASDGPSGDQDDDPTGSHRRSIGDRACMPDRAVRSVGYRGPAASSVGGIALLATKDSLLGALPPDVRVAPGALLLATGVIWGCAAARRTRRSTDRM
jgi:hypothetical protein